MYSFDCTHKQIMTWPHIIFVKLKVVIVFIIMKGLNAFIWSIYVHVDELKCVHTCTAQECTMPLVCVTELLQPRVCQSVLRQCEVLYRRDHSPSPSPSTIVTETAVKAFVLRMISRPCRMASRRDGVIIWFQGFFVSVSSCWFECSVLSVSAWCTTTPYEMCIKLWAWPVRFK